MPPHSSDAQNMAPTILFLNHNLAGQATYFRNLNFAKGLAGLGWKATVMTVAPQQSLRVRLEQDSGVRIIRTPWILPSAFLAGNGCDPWDILFRCLWCGTHRVDITVVSDHLFNVSLPFFVSRSLRRSSGYLADWADLFTRGGCHAAWVHGLRRPFYALSHYLEFYNKRVCDLAMATSRPLLRLLQTDCGKHPDRTIHLPSGCDPTFEFEPDTLPTRNILGIDPVDFVVGRTGRTGIAGRLHPHEQEAFLALHHHLLSRGMPAPLLYLVGNHDVSWYPELVGSGCRLKISGLLPSMEVPKHLRACDVFMLLEADTPFNRHRGPIRLNDYLVVGRPILCNSVGDHSETLTKAQAGLVWDDLSCVSVEVAELLSDHQLRRAMGSNARRLAENELSWPNLASRLDHFLLEHFPQLRDRSHGA